MSIVARVKVKIRSQVQQETAQYRTIDHRIRVHCPVQRHKIHRLQCRLQEDFTGVEPLKIPIICDNRSAVRLSYNPEYHQRTKHILVKYHYTRQKVNEGKNKIKYIPTEDQLADILTKLLTGPKFTKLRYRIGSRKFTGWVATSRSSPFRFWINLPFSCFEGEFRAAKTTPVKLRCCLASTATLYSFMSSSLCYDSATSPPSPPSDHSVSWSRLIGRVNTSLYRSRIQPLSEFILWRSWFCFRAFSFSLLSSLHHSVFSFSFILFCVNFPSPWVRPLLLTTPLPATSVVCGGRHLVSFVVRPRTSTSSSSLASAWN